MGEIHDTRYFRLHAVGEFIAFHAGLQLLIFDPQCLQVGCIESRKFIQCPPLMGGSLELLRNQVEDGRAGRSQPRPLVIRWQKAIAPVGRTALRQGQFRHYHVAWQVLILASQAIGCPGAKGRIASQSTPRVHMKQRFGMIQRLRLTAAIVAQFIGHQWVGQILPLVAHFNSVVTNFVKAKRAAHKELETCLLSRGQL